MRIYIASTFESAVEMRPHRDTLVKLGHEVIASWLDEGERPAHMDEETWFRQLAIKDLAEIKACDLFILCTQHTNDRAGKEVEFGYALADTSTKTYIVGPVRNIFHRIADRQFGTWAGLFAYLTYQPHRVSMNARPMFGPHW